MNCDRIAPFYRWLEYAAFGGLLQHMRVCLLHRAADSRRILILGEGDGRFLAECLRRCPAARIDVVEASAGMIEQARRRTGDDPRVRFIHRRATPDALPTGSYDLIVTHFFFDCLAQQEAGSLAAVLAERLSPRGVWIVAEFQDCGTVCTRLWLATMYAFFGATTGLATRRLPDHALALSGAGLIRSERIQRWRGLVAAELWEKTTSWSEPNAVPAED